MNSKVIAEHPPEEMYKSGLEIDCQCARCGSSCCFEECDVCSGSGYPDDDSEVCYECDGRGGNQCCLSSYDWCNANPLAGREDIERGAIEWFTTEEST